ncbi:M1 family aminopeptidase [Ekhidna sp.]|uniref:ABC transporter permease/M1 family aminopeptidase n=1 Tax=Ekhidna sp. TaxID=2608089 RepID=UPI0032EAE072
MWFKILKFEIQYRKKRPATYVYFAILFLMAVLTMSTDIIQVGGGSGLVKENSPTTIANMMAILSGIMMMITSAIMGVAVLRDFEHNTESMLFTSPITKFDYLVGRFLGSFLVVLFVFVGMMLGFMLGELFNPDKDKMLPFNLYHYLHPFATIVFPNLFFSSALFFITGALSRKMVTVYAQWILLFAVYQIALILTQEVDNRTIAALVDPFAIRTIQNKIQYWTVAEQNSMVVPFTGIVFWNRMIWVAIGIITLVVGYFSFSFNVVRKSWFKKKAAKAESASKTNVSIPTVNFNFGFNKYLLQLRKQTWFYFKTVIRSIPFKAIIGFGLFLMIVNSFFVGRVFGTYTYPTTYLMVELITNSFGLFFLIILVFYSGELVWRERDVKIHLIQDALPMPDFISLVSKFLGLILVFIVLNFFLIGSGVLIQAFKGYYKFDLPVYFYTLFTETLSFVVLFSLLAFFVQVMVNNKFLGHAVVIVFFIATGVLDLLGFEHSLFQFGSASLGTYSEMNGFGHFVTSFSWFDLYWLAFSIFLFGVAVVFAVRGSEAAMKWRWHIGKLRLSRPILTLIITTFLTFIMSGCYIFYNTNIENTYRNSDEQEALQADYERTLKKYEFLKQPKVTSISVKSEIYPYDRDYSMEGAYTLKNFEDEPIENIHLQLGLDEDLTYETVTFSRPTTIVEDYDEYRYYVHQLAVPLLPGDSITLNFKYVYDTKGFKESGSNTSIVFNGTFLNNGSFPSLGYNSGNELASDDDRKDNDLKPKERMMKRDNPIGLSQNFISDDSHGVDFEIVIGTVPDQIAIAPGYLQREWEENGRRYFHYKMDQPMMPFFNIVSARYEVVKDQTTIALNDSVTRDIDLGIYYHAGHEYNLESMMKGMKHSFKYFSENFSPYQYRQMRILEFPRYASFAQSFANTVPFSEAIGFMVKVEEEDDVDVTYFVTAHELAHQWWGHQLFPANVQGSAVLSETLSQYSALMVMKQEYPQEHLKEFLKEELNRYLRGRTTEQKKEMPLALAENQAYIHYGKGANIMYALQDYIGEDSVNVALNRLINDWGFGSMERNGRYATTIDLIRYLRDVTADSLQGVITDFFDKIILYENKVDEATYQEVSADKYTVTLDLNTKKMESDSLGYSTQITINDWIDVGIYSSDEKGKEKLIYLKKHLFTGDETSIQVEVDQKPSSAGIDPLNKLIDRNPDDNTKKAALGESS